VPRLEALLAYLDTVDPNQGWDGYVGSGGELDWSRIAISGFSQGGAMAGLIARDHEVARAMYLSNAAGGALNLLFDSEFSTCETSADCERGACCVLGSATCSEPVAAAQGYCIYSVPAQWAATGRDVDGDGRGDAGADTRATPGSRQFALVHRAEAAYGFEPDTYVAWGMGDNIVDADTVAPPFTGIQLWSTALPGQNSSCGPHQSMGFDQCQPSDSTTGLPAMWFAWKHAMGSPID
jgi:hypothetical protein